MRNLFAVVAGVAILHVPARAESPSKLAPVEPSTHVLVICPDGWEESLAPWRRHRESQGYVIHRLSADGEPDAILARVKEAARRHGAKTVLIVGDADPTLAKDIAVRAKSVPTFHPPVKATQPWTKEKEIASDNPYADHDGDRLPDLAIGRIPVDSPDELSRVIQKIIAYETSGDFGEWRRRIEFVACLGNFGGIIDSALENGARRFVTEGVPAGYVTTLTYGNWKSPYCPDPRFFHEKAMERLNEGSLFWIYIGHGQRRRVDRVMLPDKRSFPILEVAHVPNIECASGPPIALFLACFAGAFDSPEDCLAELMLKQPRGPVAIIAGSRVTMPYAMTVMGSEMMREYFSNRCPNVGELLRRAKRSMIERPRTDPASRFQDNMARTLNPKSKDLAAERAEHLDLFNLIGDPLTRLPHASPVELTLVGDPRPGSSVDLAGESPVAGQARIELVLRRDRIPITPPPRAQLSDEALRGFDEVYQKANQPVLASRTLSVSKGAFATQCEIPAQARGACHIRVFVSGPEGCAVGAVDVNLSTPSESPATALNGAR